MKQEDKELLLKDLCARLPYGVKVKVIYRAEYPDETDIEGDFFLNEIDTRYTENLYWIGGNQLQEHGFSRNISSFATCSEDEDEIVKPYLFPLSSMTEEQWDNAPRVNIDRFTFESLKCGCFTLASYTCDNDLHDLLRFIDWLLENHFDLYELIPKGLAIDATELNIY